MTGADDDYGRCVVYQQGVKASQKQLAGAHLDNLSLQDGLGSLGLHNIQAVPLLQLTDAQPIFHLQHAV